MGMLIGIDASRAFVKDKTGTENYSYELIREILKLPESRKHRFRLYVRDAELVKKSVECDSRGSGLAAKATRTDPGLETVEIKWKRLWTQGGLALECLRRPPDVLWVPAHTLPVVRRPGMKTVVTIHGIEYQYLPEFYDFKKKWYLNKSTEYAVKRADKLIAVSNWTKKQLVDELGADKDKISVVYEGIGRGFVKKSVESVQEGSGLKAKASRTDPAPKTLKKLCRQVRYKYNLPQKYVLFVGTIQPRKNLVKLIEAFAGVVKELGERVQEGSGFEAKASKTDPTQKTMIGLVIAGKKGWMVDEIYEAPKKYGVEDGVKFIGRVADADLPAVYKMAELFVWPSLMEGFGLPLLEAMQMGVPVICSDRGALPEVAGKAALQVNPEKTEEITEAIRLVLENKELREGLVEKGYKRVKQFSWKEAAKQTLMVLTT